MSPKIIRTIGINFFRLVLLATLFLDFYNGILSLHPQIPKLSSWGTLWQGLFLTVLISWAVLEFANYYYSKTAVGPLPVYFWLIIAMTTGADSLANFFLWFDINGFDKFMHFWAGFLLALVVLEFCKRIIAARSWEVKKALVYYFAIATIVTGAVIYEIGELIGDKYYGANSIISEFDTTEDLLFNLIGASVIIIFDFIITLARRTPSTKKV